MTRRSLLFFPFLVTAGCEPGVVPGSEEHLRVVTEAVDDRRLVGADERVGNWLTHGRNYAEDRFSPLDEITTKTVDRLGLVWSHNMGTRRGLEATPIVVDGVMFMTGTWSVVHAIDARTGDSLWAWDPKVPREYGRIACCDVVNRGAALYRGKVYVGTLDGRLAALDAATGNPVWETQTFDQSQPYSITGAPRVVRGLVIIGNGGAEFGVRGYVSAYHAETGQLAWRFHTVPGNPADGFESEAMRAAAETWSGEWWKSGGGGTAWDAMAFDPALDLLYVGTGNGSPWDRYHRSPGGGDNLYLSSIIALRPETGELVWHYQTTPGDHWDFTATQHLILADLEIDGRVRQVVMQAPKNGFFYVLDRATGELLSAKPYIPVTWADSVNLETGRPAERPEALYRNAASRVTPGAFGGHNWHPMAFSPQTGLVYIPARVGEETFAPDPSYQFEQGRFAAGSRWRSGSATGHLLAWNPVTQSEVWRVPYDAAWNGGVLATAGGLVFQGTGDGRFVAYDAATGENLWESPTGVGVIAPPVTYLVDGTQYVSVLAGWGGAWGLGHRPSGDAANLENVGRLYTFALDADTPLPAFRSRNQAPYQPPADFSAPTSDVATGNALYHQHCSRCHGNNAEASGVVIPDLRYVTGETHRDFQAIVREGMRVGNGMPDFRDLLSGGEARQIQSYIIERSRALATR